MFIHNLRRLCVGVLVLRIKQPEVDRPFKTPAVWITAPLGAASAYYRNVIEPQLRGELAPMPDLTLSAFIPVYP